VGWTGSGLIADLDAAARSILEVEGKRAKLRVTGFSLLIEGGRPTEVAGLLAFLPGVSWLAVGRSSRSLSGVMDELTALARVYLKRGGSFAVKAETHAPTTLPSDLIGRANSAVLDAVDGVRVNENAPSTRFRVAFDGRGGTAGVEIAEGPGGTPTGAAEAHCLVSGGIHSSVLAWLALLSGLRVELVHAYVSDGALREVARLYAELSHRVSPAALSLRVLEGRSVGEAIASWAGKTGGQVFSGVHAGRSGSSLLLPKRVSSPLYLLPEEDYGSVLASLSLKGFDGGSESAEPGRGLLRERRFGGKRADMHGVLDGLR
jgi:adenylyl- and sulfurtransferase ThiI